MAAALVRQPAAQRDIIGTSESPPCYSYSPAFPAPPFSPLPLLTLNGSLLCLPFPPCSPFKRSWSGEVGAAAQWTGEVLQLRDQGAAEQAAFLQEHMVPALDCLLGGDEWARWDADLARIWYDPAQLEELLAVHAVWRVERQAQQEARRDKRLEREAYTAAAAAATGAFYAGAAENKSADS